jgi:hypothetical protein
MDRCTGLRVPAPLGAKHRGLFLGLADEHNALIGGKLAQVFSHHVVLALSLSKLLERDTPLCGEVFQRGHEAAGHRTHQRRGGDRLATVLAEEPYNPLFGLQPRHIIRNGVVQLFGTLSDQRERRGVRVAVENVPGVTGIEDHMVLIELLAGDLFEKPKTRSSGQ